MAKLTEGMVIARTRATDLENVKKLNCWGSELCDVSLLRKMANVEVLSLSVNNISSLADFQLCYNLQELYIRKNNIKNITEICYLKELPKLRNLWLEDNPCAVGDKYRLTVLKMLPQLQKLDNIVVHPEELRDASIYGLDLIHPEDKNKNENILSSSSSSISPSYRSDMDRNRCISEEYDAYNSNSSVMHIAKQQMNRREEQNRQDAMERELERRAQQEEENRRRLQQQKEDEYRREVERRNSQQTCIQSRASALFGCYGGESATIPTAAPATTNRPTSNPLPDANAIYQSRPYAVENYSETPEENANMHVSISQDAHIPQSNFTSMHGRISPSRPYPVRPKTRNSNILSAVLCLIKELDYASLEVVEMAVRCRMDELDD